MKPPTSCKEVQCFIGIINYYRNMWPRWSQTLARLTRLMSIKGIFKWTQVKQDAFEKITRIMAHDSLSKYPDLMLASYNWERLSYIKANRSLSTV